VGARAEEAPEILYDGSTGDTTVVAYDPGGVTGWALASVHPDSIVVPEIRILDNISHFACGQIVGDEFRQVDQMVGLANEWPGASLVIEDFVLAKMSADRALLSPVRLTSAFRYEMRKESNGERVVRKQGRSLAFTTVTDDRLKRYRGGYYAATAGQEHARDATKHLFTWLKRLKENVRLRIEVFPDLR
jgi:hypothetical protein